MKGVVSHVSMNLQLSLQVSFILPEAVVAEPLCTGWSIRFRTCARSVVEPSFAILQDALAEAARDVNTHIGPTYRTTTNDLVWRLCLITTVRAVEEPCRPGG